MTFGELVQQQREAKGMSRTELAQRLRVTRVTINRIEANTREPSVGLYRQLIDALDLAPDVAGAALAEGPRPDAMDGDGDDDGDSNP